MLHFPRWSAFAFAALVLAFSAPNAHAFVSITTTENYTFSGLCTDCTGTATAELTLHNYTDGNPLSIGNFGSFHYDGTDLLSAFTINTAQAISGEVPVAAEGNFHLQFAFNSQTYFFNVSGNGNWSIGPSLPADFGTGGVFTDSAPAPEPATLALFGAGLAALGLLRRKTA